MGVFYDGNVQANNVMGSGVLMCVCGHLVSESLDVSLVERQMIERHRPPIDPDAGFPPKEYMSEPIDGTIDSKGAAAFTMTGVVNTVKHKEFNDDDLVPVHKCENCQREVTVLSCSSTSRGHVALTTYL